MDDNLNLVSCKKCLKKVLDSALSGHLDICTGKPPEKEVFVKPEPIQPIKVVEIPPLPVTVPIVVKKPVKKRKVPTEVTTKPKEPKKTKTNTIFNLDVQCGVFTETGVKCARSITCKMVSRHSNCSMQSLSRGQYLDDRILMTYYFQSMSPNKPMRRKVRTIPLIARDCCDREETRRILCCRIRCTQTARYYSKQQTKILPVKPNAFFYCDNHLQPKQAISF